MSDTILAQVFVGLYITTNIAATSWIMANLYRLRQEVSRDYSQLHTNDVNHSARISTLESEIHTRGDIIVRTEARLEGMESRLSRLEIK